jgi:hypothetical protein
MESVQNQDKTKKILWFAIVGLLLILVVIFFYKPSLRFTHASQFADGSIYKGEFDEKGLMSGFGRLDWSNGSFYEGEFSQGLFEGQGKSYAPGFGTYLGGYSKGMLHGKGRLTQQDGSVYEGDFFENQIHGKGKIQYTNGVTYEGDFNQDQQTGKGTFWYADGSIYEGDLVNGKMEGSGKMTYENGSIYEGEYRNGTMHGKGVLTDGKSQRYSGYFEQGKFSGEGVLTNEEGETLTGEFKSGLLEGAGTKVDADGNKWEGNFERGMMKGEGTYRGKKDGTYYEGMFDYDEFDGKGKLIEKNGDIYEGEFNWGRKDGKGVLTLKKPKNGQSKIEGEWQNDQLIKATGAVIIYDEETITDFALENQSAILKRDIDQLQSSDDNKVEIFSLILAGDGTQEVFNRELNYVKNFLSTEFANQSHSLYLSNTRYELTKPLATMQNLRLSIEALATKMDKEKDILFIYATSHGSKDKKISLHHKGLSLKDIHANEFADLLKKSGIKHKVIILSACYAGGFIDDLKDETSLIITSAAKNRRSFGCSDERHFTYFGRAYFKYALPKTRDFEQAFYRAEKIIRGWEKKDKQKASNPQIYVGDEIRTYLKAWNWDK